MAAQTSRNNSLIPQASVAPLRDSFLSEEQLARELPNCNVRKLRNWRRLRTGPKWLRVGRAVIYLRASVEAWMRENEIAISREQRPLARRSAR
jgi:hypothetical protein